MNHNADPQNIDPQMSRMCRLDQCTDAVALRGITKRLWCILDDIDTASDMFKPRDESGYKRFYEYAMNKAGRRFALVTSDGHDLFVPKKEEK